MRGWDSATSLQVMTADGRALVIRPVFAGLKGDWPYIRKVAKLKTGFQATIPRKCHLCDIRATLPGKQANGIFSLRAFRLVYLIIHYTQNIPKT